jgi:hypothetical protein
MTERNEFPDHIRKELGLYDKKPVDVKKLSWFPTMTVRDFVDSNIYTFYDLYCE